MSTLRWLICLLVCSLVPVAYADLKSVGTQNVGSLSQLPAIASGTVLGNNSGSTAAPSALSGAVTYGMLVNNFAGLQFAFSPANVGSPTGTMTNYAVGDTVTIQCTGVSFTTSPVLSVNAVSTGSITAVVVTNSGITSGSVPSGAVSCSQASTSGTGTGLQISGVLGLIASYIYPASLTTGGAANNGNFYLNTGPNDADSWNSSGGSENTFLGDKAGHGLIGGSNFGTAVGHNACGSGGSGATGSAGGNNVCMGTDAGRNIQGSTAYQNVIIGSGAGRNEAGRDNIAIGFNAGAGTTSNTAGNAVGVQMVAVGSGACQNTTGNNNVCLGYNAGSSITTGGNDIIIGRTPGGTLTTGSNDVVIGTSATCDVSAAGASNEVHICAGSTDVIKVTGAGTPSTSSATVAGSLNVVGTLQQNGSNIAVAGSQTYSYLSFQPGLVAAIVNTKGAFAKVSKASTVDNIEGSASSFTCTVNPTITMYECGTSTTCAAPTTIGTATVTASGTVVDGTVSNSAITAGDYVAWAVTAGTCTGLDIAANAQVHTN